MPNARAHRAILLHTAAAWTVVGVLMGALIFPSRMALVMGVVLELGLLTAAVVLAWPLRCPHCAGRIFFSGRVKSDLKSGMLKQLFFPAEYLKADQIVCPQCGKNAQLSTLN